MVKIEERLRKLVIAKIQDGASQRQVSKELGICRSSIQNLWLKFAKTGSISDRPRSGRPMKSTERDRRHLCIEAKKAPFCSAREHGERSHLIPKVSVITVRRYLRKSGLFGQISARKPLLSKLQAKRRLEWCKAYLSYTAADWDRIVFSDECRVATYTNSRRYVWRPKNSRYKDKYCCKTVKYGGKSVLVWGAIRADGNRILIQCPPRLDSREYQQVLSQGLPEVYESHMTFMQDGAPCHRSSSTSEFLDNRKVCLLSDWPAQSPDLNIIENMWAELKNKLSKYHPIQKENLWEVIEKEWYSIPNDYVTGLYKSLPRRINQVVKNKGLHSKY